ncbi:glycosyltransferase family A protein [Alkalihalobacterium elongatum]|uniref:glycosyltransferase family A protein n=1 Tax=Alkalihalobacterium elongatum TaxID=2675466 RepID=UPI001C1F26FA|nr:glycosyltransferase family A protein [Alkalihalobacterium elongatum]
MVSIITCTNRQAQIDYVFQNFQNQLWEPKELIVILNKDDMDINKWKEKAHRMKNVTIYQKPEILTLGECLNFGITKAKFDYIAKFDDDDYYGPYYLRHSMNSFKQTNASVVGKRTAFVYFERENVLALHTPNYENMFITKKLLGHYQLVKGATLIFKKKIFERVQFKKIHQGGDTQFIKDCLAHGFQFYSTNKYDFVQIRRSDLSSHTWKEKEESILKRCQIVSRTKDFESFVIKKPNDLIQ